jgi:hypothetical protein
MVVELIIEGIFGQHPDKLAPHKFCSLKLDDPRISDKYRKILHKQFEMIVEDLSERQRFYMESRR